MNRTIHHFRKFMFGSLVFFAGLTASAALAQDTDGDGLDDAIENTLGTNILEPDSGFSIDNLAPNAPLNLQVTYGANNELS